MEGVAQFFDIFKFWPAVIVGGITVACMVYRSLPKEFHANKFVNLLYRIFRWLWFGVLATYFFSPHILDWFKETYDIMIKSLTPFQIQILIAICGESLMIGLITVFAKKTKSVPRRTRIRRGQLYKNIISKISKKLK